MFPQIQKSETGRSYSNSQMATLIGETKCLQMGLHRLVLWAIFWRRVCDGRRPSPPSNYIQFTWLCCISKQTQALTLTPESQSQPVNWRNIQKHKIQKYDPRS